MNQLALVLEARAEGEEAAERCAQKAEAVAAFDREGASKFILGYLRRHGNTAGEILTEQAIAHGYRVHDARAFGAVYQSLVRKNLIRCAGFCARKHGHGTAGGRVWEATR